MQTACRACMTDAVLRHALRWRQVRETRALMCCFAAVDPREACLQQLRHTEDWSPIDQDTDRRQCYCAWVSPLYVCLLPRSDACRRGDRACLAYRHACSECGKDMQLSYCTIRQTESTTSSVGEAGTGT